MKTIHIKRSDLTQANPKDIKAGCTYYVCKKGNNYYKYTLNLIHQEVDCYDTGRKETKIYKDTQAVFDQRIEEVKLIAEQTNNVYIKNR